MACLVYLAARSNSRLTADLARAGYRVFEAHAVSEALYLCEIRNVDAIVIAADVDEPDVVEAQLRRITIRLNPDATVKDLVWELSQLFPGKTMAVQ